LCVLTAPPTGIPTSLSLSLGLPIPWDNNIESRPLNNLKPLRAWGQTPILEEILLWVKCYQTASHDTERCSMTGRVNWFGKLHCCLILRTCNSHCSPQQPSTSRQDPPSAKTLELWKLRWLAFFSNKVFLITLCGVAV
jgi:hypothetical protein